MQHEEKQYVVAYPSDLALSDLVLQGNSKVKLTTNISEADYYLYVAGSDIPPNYKEYGLGKSAPVPCILISSGTGGLGKVVEYFDEVTEDEVPNIDGYRLLMSDDMMAISDILEAFFALPLGEEESVVDTDSDAFLSELNEIADKEQTVKPLLDIEVIPYGTFEVTKLAVQNGTVVDIEGIQAVADIRFVAKVTVGDTEEEFPLFTTEVGTIVEYILSKTTLEDLDYNNLSDLSTYALRQLTKRGVVKDIKGQVIDIDLSGKKLDLNVVQNALYATMSDTGYYSYIPQIASILLADATAEDVKTITVGFEIIGISDQEKQNVSFVKHTPFPKQVNPNHPWVERVALDYQHILKVDASVSNVDRDSNRSPFVQFTGNKQQNNEALRRYFEKLGVVCNAERLEEYYNQYLSCLYNSTLFQIDALVDPLKPYGIHDTVYQQVDNWLSGLTDKSLVLTEQKRGDLVDEIYRSLRGEAPEKQPLDVVPPPPVIPWSNLGGKDEKEPFLDRLDKVKERKRMGAIKRLTFISAGVIVLMILALTYALSLVPKASEYNQITKPITQNTRCAINFPNGDVIEGRREYSYTYDQIFGIRWIDTTTIEERTFLTVDTSGLTVVAQKIGGDHTTVKVPNGEFKNLELPNYPQYTFIRNGEIVVLDYKAFCR